MTRYPDRMGFGCATQTTWARHSRFCSWPRRSEPPVFLHRSLRVSCAKSGALDRPLPGRPSTVSMGGMLAFVPLAFTLCLDACAVDEKVQRSGAATKLQTHFQCHLSAKKGAEIGHRAIQSNQTRQAFDEPFSLPQEHPGQHLQGPTGLDLRVAELRPTTSDASRGRVQLFSRSNQIESDPRQFSASWYDDQCVVLYFGEAQLPMPPSYHAGFMT